MIGEREILACANTLLRQHGDRAQSVIAKRVAALTEQSDLAGGRMFCRIQEQVRARGRYTPAAAH